EHHDDHRGITVMVTGNRNHAEFNQWFKDGGSPLQDPSIQLYIYKADDKGRRQKLVLHGPNVPTAKAYWAEHSGDTADLQNLVTQEKNRAMTAEAGLSSDIAAERAARIAGDQQLQSNIDAEATARRGDVTAINADIAAHEALDNARFSSEAAA